MPHGPAVIYYSGLLVSRVDSHQYEANPKIIIIIIISLISLISYWYYSDTLIIHS